MEDVYSFAPIGSGAGGVLRTTIGLKLAYSSRRATNEAASAGNTALGYGWTHSYNVFLYTYQANLFRRGPTGRITQFKRVPGSNPIRYQPNAGYFESLVRNADGTYTIAYPDGTTEKFKNFAGCPYLFVSAIYQLVERLDRNGNKITLIYDIAGRLNKVVDQAGRSIAFTYDARNRVLTITDVLGRVTRLTHSSAGGQLTQINDPAGKTVTYQYDGQYRVIRKVDKSGRICLYTYGAGLRKAEQLNPDGSRSPLVSVVNSTDWAIDQKLLAQNFRTEYLPSTVTNTDARGNIWIYAYDKNAYPIQTQGPLQPIPETISYDPATLKRALVTDANGHTTSYAYDAKGNLVRMTNALGHVTTYAYEPTYNQVVNMIDPKERVTTYQYDARGNRIKDIDPLLQVRGSTYDPHGNVLTATDRNGHVTTYFYDSSDNQVRLTDPMGNVTTMTYDAAGNLLSRTDANGHTTSYQYDSMNRLIQETDPIGAVTIIAYDAMGNRTAITDRNFHATLNEYDVRQRLIKTTDPSGHPSTMTYDGNGNRTTVTDRNGHTTQFAYDAQNRLIRRTDPLGGSTTMTYDAVGNLLTLTDASGHTTTFTYDALNRRVTTTDALGYATLVEYDGGGTGGCGACGVTPGAKLVTKETDGNGKVIYYKYDALDRRTKEIRKQGDAADVIDSDDAVTSYAYDANGNLTAVTEPNGNTTTYQYDALNRRTHVTNGAGNTATATHDGVGNVVTALSPNGNVLVMFYDARDRLIQVDDGIGRVANYSYDAVGNRLSATDGNHNVTTYAYDALDRLVTATDALGRTTSTQYDPVGNVVATTDREGRVTTHVYDSADRRISTTDALSATVHYQYDAVGNLTKAIDANGHATQFAYDAIDRLIKEQYADQAPNVRTFAYDAVNLISRTDQKGRSINYSYSDLYFLLQRSYPTSPADNFTYDLSGRMLTADHGGWLVSFVYDGANRIVQSIQNGRAIGYRYDIPGRTRELTCPGGRIITERMDLRGRRTQIVDSAAPTAIAQYAYDVGNRVGARVYRNGVVATYTYNANDWVSKLEHKIGATLIAGFRYEFDREGNKTLEEKLHETARSEAYRYDDLYRLIDYKVGAIVDSDVAAPTVEAAYTLDPVGNWDGVVRNGVSHARTHNAVNEILTIDGNPITYDDNGNLQSDSTYSYAYDDENRLVTVTRNSDATIVVRFGYDAIGRRVQKIGNASGVPGITRYFYDDARVIEEQDDAGVTQATYVYGNYIDEVLTMDRGGQTYYYHQNSLMSVAALTDSAGNPVERYAFDGFGTVSVSTGDGVPLPDNAWNTPHSAAGNAYLFTGRVFDEETGLYHYRARYYDAEKGRFLQRDPLRYRDARNLYAYVQNRPLRLVDPTGLVEDCLKQKKTIKMMGYDEFDFPFEKDQPGLEATVEMPSTKLGSLFDALGVAQSFYKAYHAAFDDHEKNARDDAQSKAAEECNKFCAPFTCIDSDACCVGELGEGKFKGKIHDKRNDPVIENAPQGWRRKTTDFQIAVEGSFTCTCKCERSWLQKLWDAYIDLDE